MSGAMTAEDARLVRQFFLLSEPDSIQKSTDIVARIERSLSPIITSTPCCLCDECYEEKVFTIE